MKIGEENSATSLQNMLDALDMIDKGNEIRRSLGLREWTVNDADTADAQLAADYNTYSQNTGHVFTGTSQNLAWGYENPYDGWYTEEKAVFDQYAEKNPELRNMTAVEIYMKYPDIYEQTGHYLNIIDPDCDTTGFAITGSLTAAQNFSQKYLYTSGVSVDEYRQQILSYKNALDSAADTYQKALDKANEAKKAAQQAQQELAELQERAQSAQQTADEAAKTAKAKDEAYQKALDAYNAAVKAGKTADSTYAQAKDEADAKQTVYEQKQSTTKKAQSEFGSANQQVKTAQSNVDKAQAAVDEAKKQVKEAQAKLDGYTDANAKLAEARRS